MYRRDPLRGFTYNADTYCLGGCLPVPALSEEVGAIFTDSEWDSPVHCTVCRVLIPTALTSEGYRYIREALASGQGDPEIMDQWRYNWAIEEGR